VCAGQLREGATAVDGVDAATGAKCRVVLGVGCGNLVKVFLSFQCPVPCHSTRVYIPTQPRSSGSHCRTTFHPHPKSTPPPHTHIHTHTHTFSHTHTHTFSHAHTPPPHPFLNRPQHLCPTKHCTRPQLYILQPQAKNPQDPPVRVRQTRSCQRSQRSSEWLSQCRGPCTQGGNGNCDFEPSAAEKNTTWEKTLPTGCPSAHHTHTLSLSLSLSLSEENTRTGTCSHWDTLTSSGSPGQLGQPP